MTETMWLERAGRLDLEIRNWVDGKWIAHSEGQSLPKSSARDGHLLYELHAGAPGDVGRAVTQARTAFSDGRWSKLPVQSRKDVLFKLADLLEARKEEFALLECLDVGKPITNALNDDVPRAVGAIREAAEAADKVFTQASIDGPAPNMVYQVRKPVGVVGAIVGWNFPLSLAATKAGPALAMGNSLVLKPSEFTSLSAARLAELAAEAGVPEGVFNVVHGSGAIVGDALARHRDVDLLTFTGSSATGKRLLVSSGESNMKRLMLECGGKSPYIIFDDCPEDLDFIAKDAVETAFPNQGELCAAGTRLLVQESIRDQIMPRLLEHATKLVPADPLDPATSFGALINEPHLNKVLGYIESGKQDGAKLIHAGRRVEPVAGGYYLEPSVFDGVQSDHRIAREEIFGPVLSVMTFKDEEDAIRMANESNYGLAAYACTTNLGRAQRVGQRLDAGVVMIVGTSTLSAGGVGMGIEPHKESGFGMEGGIGGLAAYTVTNTVYVLT